MASTRFVRLGRTTVLVLSLAASALVIPGIAQAASSPSGSASPTPAVSSSAPAVELAAEPTTAAQAQVKLASLSHESEQLSEQLNAAKIAVAKAKSGAALAADAADFAQLELTVAQQNLAVSLSAQYKASSFSHTAALLSSSSGQNYLETVASMHLIASYQAEVTHAAAIAGQRSQLAQTASAHAAALALTKQKSLAAKSAALTAQVSKYTQLLATLTAAARVKFFAATTASPVQVQRLKFAPAVAASKIGKVVIAAAMAQLGKPYVYGASGPGSFDCSGLTAWAFAAAGIALPHNAAAQDGYGTHVSAGQLQPGDLVFFYSPISHVGIYVGNGLMIHAPTSGDVVKISSVFGNGDFAGATRLG